MHMPAGGRSTHSRCCLLLGLVPAVTCLYLTSGCGGESSTKPAPVEQGQMKKAQEYMANYREQMVAANKGKGKAKAKEPGKSSP